MRLRACEGADNGVTKLQRTKRTLGTVELLSLASVSNERERQSRGKTVSNRYMGEGQLRSISELSFIDLLLRDLTGEGQKLKSEQLES